MRQQSRESKMVANLVISENSKSHHEVRRQEIDEEEYEKHYHDMVFGVPPDDAEINTILKRYKFFEKQFVNKN